MEGGRSLTGSKTAQKAPSKGRKAAAARPRPRPVAGPAREKVLEEFAAAMKAFQKRDYARARDLFRSLVEKHPEEAEVVDRARGLLRVCEREMHTEVPRLKGADEHCTQGVIDLNRGNLEEALEHFRTATEDGGGGRAFYLLACALAQAGRSQEAVSALQRSVEADPANRPRAANERDFDALREDPAFQKILSGSRETSG